MELIEAIKHLRELMDEFYELSTRSKVESNIYLEIDEQINKVLGLAMSEIVKKEGD